MPSKRNLEDRIDQLEASTDRHESSESDELTEAQLRRIDDLMESLDDELREELTEISARIDAEPEDAETCEYGLTDAERAYLDALTGGRQ